MKALLTILFLTFASVLHAQERVELSLIWAPDPSFANTAMYEDGDCATMTAGLDNKLQYIAYELPDHRAPDSVTFVLTANCEFFAFSGWSVNNQLNLGYEKNRAGSITFKYQKQLDKRAYCVGVAVSQFTSEGDIQRGTVCIDAAYAWYHTLSVREQITDVFIDVQQAEWYDEAGHFLFYGTRKELQASGLKGMFFSRLGKYCITE